MKTYEQLMTHYWGTIVPMAKAAGISPLECVQMPGRNIFSGHPHFVDNPELYIFAISILEGKPVFVCDNVYNKITDEWYVIKDTGNPCLSCYTWTYPTKKRTFMLGDEEFSDDEISYIIESIFERDGGYTTDLLRKLRQVRSKQNAM